MRGDDWGAEKIGKLENETSPLAKPKDQKIDWEN
jgi:hypothetical protein